MDARIVSIWTVQGRMKNLGFASSPDQLKLLADHRQGESDLLCRDGQWFLAVTCEVSEAEENPDPVGFVGVDLGIVEIAATSTGDRFAGRVLKRLRRREARRGRDVNHTISQRIVERAERTDHGIVLEDLRGIRGRVRQAKQQRAALHSWGFAQLRDFIGYKARRVGVPVLVVDPAYTSQTCSECDHTSRRNRSTRGRFVCQGCGVVLHADVNASRNLAHRGQVAWNAGRRSTAPTPST